MCPFETLRFALDTVCMNDTIAVLKRADGKQMKAASVVKWAPPANRGSPHKGWPALRWTKAILDSPGTGAASRVRSAGWKGRTGCSPSM